MDEDVRRLERLADGGDVDAKNRLKAMQRRLGKLKSYLVEYDSNNSGGRWWLSSKDWKALEEAGWKITRNSFLGNVPASATKSVEADSEDAARELGISEWTNLTNQFPDVGGCECCGPPHYFSVSEDLGI